MAQIRHHLAAHEHERHWTPPSSRRTELDEMIAEDIETLCQAFVRLAAAVEPTA
jgi:hypothetical protein